MIPATIKSGNHDLTLEIPFERERLAQSLSEMEIREPPGGFFLRDEPSEELSVKLDTTENIFSFELRLIVLFDRNTSLRDANSLCKLVLALPDSLREQLNTDMRAGTVSNRQEFIPRLQTIRENVCEAPKWTSICNFQLYNLRTRKESGFFIASIGFIYNFSNSSCLFFKM